MRAQTILLILTLLTTVALAQPRTIKGRLLDAETRKPIPGWNVIEPNTKNGTVTDMKGEFTLTLASRPTVIWFPQCFTQLYVEYAEDVDFKEIMPGPNTKAQIFKDSKKIEQKLARARPTRDLFGEVIDKKSKQPLDSCEVRIKGTDNLVYTDSKGSFMIAVPNNRTVELEIKKGKILRIVSYDRDQTFRQVKLRR